MYGQRSLGDELRYQLREGDAHVKLIFLNVAVFIFINLVQVILLLSYGREGSAGPFSTFLSYIMIPADLGQLLRRPWTIITHMFAHYGLFHIIFNMLWLYWFGNILRGYIGNNKTVPIYILGALTGAVLYILSYNIFPGLRSEMAFSRALGASAGVLAIILATATLVPNHTIFLLFLGAVRLKWIALVLIILDLVSIAGTNTGGHIAHLGGALFGFIFIKQLQQGNDMSGWVNKPLDWLTGLFSRRGPRVAYRNVNKPTAGAPPKAAPLKKEGDENKQKKLDTILDKISTSGYDSLTKEEKDFLFKVSKEE